MCERYAPKWGLKKNGETKNTPAFDSEKTFGTDALIRNIKRD